ncbi:YciI family protein [Aquisalinus flavus]|uniref:YCII-related domain-containing protein n=1 Tax=Aquisalinus flavus TaxID=1526572 RepID=A0A8J2V776_9PROT|nr:YciI family protein [Aquisalinus flavus]MBD0425515.1 YciI family protein [Aquisalinus flavus]UNE48854.1 YciI family protein [Aquisalinus flavus]GGD15454.1 hypothetical protein GCM10011342_25280 [Aquisalinus flavus]
MPHFILICRDGPDGAAKRPGVRPQHLDHVADHSSTVKLAGPLLDEDGNPAGSLFLLDMETRAEVEAFSAADPYQKAGVFVSREIRTFRIVVDNLSD